ncbi:MAG TPA: hypothetical protein VM328_10595, partial [Fimbriimonadaceae bacterium]|nr:hypothetical protein [Fimbriimonadaceae bacterium]
MIVPFLAGVFLLRPVHFPPQPIQHEIERGIEVYRQGKGLERVLMEDRQIVGWWFNGKIKEGVEEVVWISPSLVSRWLGYLWAQEKWAGGELERRYGRLRARLRGQMWFMTRLSRLPKMDFLGEEEPPRPMSFKPEPVRLLFTTGADLPSPSTSFRLKVARRLGEPEPEFEPHEGLRVALAPVGLAEISGREWGALKGFPWYLTTHLLQELWPEFEEPA